MVGFDSAVRALSVDSNLSTVDMLWELERQLHLVKDLLNVDSDPMPLRKELVRPVLKLMTDEINTIIYRIDAAH